VSLHLVFSQRGWEACRVRRGADDAVLFLGDGVYAALQASGPDHRVLSEDAQIRGLAIDPARCVDYDGMVALCSQHAPLVSWND